ncbi:ABC transporter permease [Brevibacillus ginsengisoli]|uniref:ABC transporter permease n=1 Tax=Brevibacillus ginsengisoli TaxID=363854 RepID=UPI003CF50EB9
MQKVTTVAWRNLKRKPARTVLLAGSAAMTAFLLFASYFFLYSMEQSVTASSARLGADLLVVPDGFGSQAGEMMISGNPTKFYMKDDIIPKIEQLPEVEQVAPQLYLETVKTVCCRVEGDFPIVAFDPTKDFTLKAWMASNREFKPYDLLIGSNAGGKNFIYHLDYQAVQEKVVLFNETFLVQNVLFPTGMGTDHTIFMNLATAREIASKQKSELNVGPHDISVLLIKTKPNTEEFVKRQIERMNLPIDVVKGSGLREALTNQLFPVKFLSYTMIVLMIIMSAMQVATMFSAIISERRKEIGMIRAMGATKGTTYKLLLWEAGLASMIGGVVGSVLSAAMLYDNRALILQLVKLPLLFPNVSSGVGIGLIVSAVTVLIAICAAYFPVRSALKVEPYEAIREGE